MKKNIKIFFTLILVAITFSCTEPYALQSNNFEDLLVVEATITNELINQEIVLSRTFSLDNYNNQEVVKNAIVKIVDTDGNVFDFEFNEDRYISTSPFQAISGKKYQLQIAIGDKNYTSTYETITTATNLDNIQANVKIKDGESGVEIVANSLDPTNTSKYYRYDYTETYKVIAPYWVNKYLQAGTPYNVDLLDRDLNIETKTCYKTQENFDIIQYNTTSLPEDRVSNFEVKFIKQSDYSIANRYSILVKQYIQNYEAYVYYNLLKKQSDSGETLSPFQPGFIEGNIKNVSNSNEKIVGFFDVSHVSSKRIFFNYEDLFPGQLPPDYFMNCTPESFDFSGQEGERLFYALIKNNSYLYYSGSGVLYELVNPFCGDCTTYASPIVPSFWY